VTLHVILGRIVIKSAVPKGEGRAQSEHPVVTCKNQCMHVDGLYLHGKELLGCCITLAQRNPILRWESVHERFACAALTRLTTSPTLHSQGATASACKANVDLLPETYLKAHFCILTCPCTMQSFLTRALMPLHKPKCVSMYHQQLAYCVTQARVGHLCLVGFC